MLDSLKDPTTGKLKPAVIIGAGGVAAVGMFLILGKGSSGGSQAGGTPGVVSGGQSGDNTAALSDLQDAITQLGNEIAGHSNTPPGTTTPPVTPPATTPPATTPPSVKKLIPWGSDISPQIRALDPTGAKINVLFTKYHMDPKTTINLIDLQHLATKQGINYKTSIQPIDVKAILKKG